MNMQTDEFKKGLIEILERHNYAAPTEKHLNEIRKRLELEDLLGPDYDPETFILEHVKYFNLVEKKEYAIILDLFKFLQYNYDDYYTFSKGGMARYMAEHEINNGYKSMLVKKNFLLGKTTGGRYYKFNLKSVRHQEVYHTILDFKKLIDAEGEPFELIEEDESIFIKQVVKKEEETPKEIDQVIEPPEEPEEPQQDSEPQYQELVGKIPPADATIRKEIFKARTGRYSDNERLMLVWCVYRGFTPVRIANVLKRRVRSIEKLQESFKDCDLKRTDDQERYLVNGLDALLKLFKKKRTRRVPNVIEETEKAEVKLQENDQVIKSDELVETEKPVEVIDAGPVVVEEKKPEPEPEDNKYTNLEKRVNELERLVIKLSSRVL